METRERERERERDQLKEEERSRRYLELVRCCCGYLCVVFDHTFGTRWREDNFGPVRSRVRLALNSKNF